MNKLVDQMTQLVQEIANAKAQMMQAMTRG
jgi:hypothetical protein